MIGITIQTMRRLADRGSAIGERFCGFLAALALSGGDGLDRFAG
ncbi:MAG: hypothetical protein ACR2QQ_13360 [Gammaproteobacteria bacterium]